ncbi:MAG: glycosyl hydrolase family 28 protein [Bacteroidales bacterium]|nr:glycosyl hydrolase family 28 protein [Bacteroidales bacterium]
MKYLRISMIYMLYLVVRTNGVDAQKFNIVDFGAKADNATVNTIYIQKAIDSCANKGGGTVYVPAGIFVTGTIELKSNVNLELESGAILRGSPDIKHYKPYTSPLFNVPTHYGLIFAYQAHNVSITGRGAIDGNEEAFFMWDRPKKIEWGGLVYTRQKENFRKVESGIGDGPVEPKQDRPRQMIIFSQCKNVLVKDVQIIKSPFWSLHFADCDGVIATGLKIWGSLVVPNNDGIDITSCNNVIVSDCDIRTGDDAIVITGYAYHFELPGYYNLRHASENIVVTNCNLQSRSSGIRVGFQDQNSVKNIHFSNINITNSNRGIGIFVRDEGSLENITFSQITIFTRLHTGDWWGHGEPIHISAVKGTESGKLGKIKNVSFRDITCVGENGILLFGSEGSTIEDITFENLKFTLTNSPLNAIAGGNIDLRGAFGDKQLFASDISALYCQYVKNITFNRVEIIWDNVTDSFFKYGIHLKEFRNATFENVKCISLPEKQEQTTVVLQNGKGYSYSKNNKAHLKKIHVQK